MGLTVGRRATCVCGRRYAPRGARGGRAPCRIRQRITRGTTSGRRRTALRVAEVARAGEIEGRRRALVSSENRNGQGDERGVKRQLGAVGEKHDGATVFLRGGCGPRFGRGVFAGLVAVRRRLAVEPSVQVRRGAGEHHAQHHRRQRGREHAPRRGRHRSEWAEATVHDAAKWTYASKCVKPVRRPPDQRWLMVVPAGAGARRDTRSGSMT